MNELWDYPAGPVTNSFGSHPDYDEARGPFDPSGDYYVPIGQLAEVPADDEGDEDEDVELDEPKPFQPFLCAETARGWWTAPFAPPVVETKVCLKEFDRGTRRWRRVARELPLTL
jgi:hypothetical protein